MTYKLRILAGTACLLAFPLNLSAQEAGQTPENAQLFLAKVIAAGGVQVTAKSPEQYSYGVSRGFFGDSIVNFPYGSATWWKHLPQQDGAVCMSQVGVYGKYGARRNTRAGGTEIVMNSLWSIFAPTDSISDDRQEYATVNGSGILLWSQVSAVEVSGAEVTLPITYAGGGVRFQFPTADLAKRAGFAMEVLRLACDATADENF